MRAQGDHADGLFAGHGAQRLAHPRARRAKPRLAENVDRNEVAVFAVAAIFGGDCEFASHLFLVDRLDANRSVRCNAQDAQNTIARARQHFDDAADIRRIVGAGVAIRLGANKRAVADAGEGLPRPWLSRSVNGDARSRTQLFRIPFGRNGDKFAVSIALGDIGQRHGRQDARFDEPLAAPLDRALGLKLRKQPLESDAIGALDPESARDFSLADLSNGADLRHRLTLARDESQYVLFRGQRRGTHRVVASIFCQFQSRFEKTRR